MLTCVAIFGVATIVFGYSTSPGISFLALFVLGAADMVSMVIRGTLVQLNTPDEMRGRVSAVNLILPFIGASNELGEFESGVTARYCGTVEAVALGGLGTLVVVFMWTLLFPEDPTTQGANKITTIPRGFSQIRNLPASDRTQLQYRPLSRPALQKYALKSRTRASY